MSFLTPEGRPRAQRSGEGGGGHRKGKMRVEVSLLFSKTSLFNRRQRAIGVTAWHLRTRPQFG